ALEELFSHAANRPGFVLHPVRKLDSDGEPMFSTPHTADYWHDAQAWLDKKFGPGQVIAPLIIASDATILSGNDRQRVWAVYLSIANIALRLRWRDEGRILLALLPEGDKSFTPAEKVALFQAAMAVVLEDLTKASHT
ncbi:unnamed protein product, partial [Closterium sp. Naga37s-1]